MSNYKKAYIIGRFQPFHKGHLYLIKEALKKAEKAVIGVGSANVSNFDNPYSTQERLQMLMSAITASGLDEYVEKIVTIDDVPNDNDWLRLALEKVEGVDLVVGNNDWVNDIFEQAGYAVLRVPYYKRHIYEGKKIREHLRSKGLIR